MPHVETVEKVQISEIFEKADIAICCKQRTYFLENLENFSNQEFFDSLVIIVEYNPGNPFKSLLAADH
jgi:hypothetical protein